MSGLKPTYPIAIHLGEKDACAAQLRRTRKGFTLRALAFRKSENGADADATLLSLLKDMSGIGGFEGKRVSLHIPSHRTNCFPITFQVGRTESLEEAILRHSREYLSFPVEEAVMDYPSLVPVSGNGGQYRAMVVAVQRPHLEQYLRTLKQAGLTAEIVDFPVCSLIRLHRFLEPPVPNPVILCYVGYWKCEISVVSGEEILLVRNIPWGIGPLLARIRENLDLTGDDRMAKLLLRRYGLIYETPDSREGNNDSAGDRAADPMGRVIYQVINPYLEELIDELHQTIGYLRSEAHQGAAEGIFLYGCDSLGNLNDYVEKRLGLPTKQMDPRTSPGLFPREIPSDGVYGPSLAPVIGLAMRKVPWL